jgi:GNAT superfamily N-acetyltransferase
VPCEDQRVADASVRAARPEDVGAIAAVQVRAWRAAYPDLLPPAAVDEEAFARTWGAAVRTPPTGRHRVLVALDGADVAGFAAFGPAQGHPDLDPASVVEVHSLVVDPAAQRAGHGSRLQAALADIARDDGFVRACIWVAADDEALRHFLVTSGWGPDGAERELDLRGDGEVLVRQTRLRTVLADDTAGGTTA